MAILDSIFVLTGKFGNTYIKRQEGKLIVQSLPKKKKKKEKNSNSRRFGFLQELYHILFSDKDLHKYWKLNQPNKKGANTFFSHVNGKLVRSVADIHKTLFSPIPNFVLEHECELFMEDTFLMLKIPRLTAAAGLNNNTENYLKVFGFYYMHNPKEGKEIPYSFHNIKTILVKIQYETDIVFQLDQLIKNLNPFITMTGYNDIELHVGVLTFTEANSPVRTSQKMILPLTFMK